MLTDGVFSSLHLIFIYKNWFSLSLTGGLFSGVGIPRLAFGFVFILHTVLVEGEVGRGVRAAAGLRGGGARHQVRGATHQPLRGGLSLVVSQVLLPPVLDPRGEFLVEL